MEVIGWLYQFYISESKDEVFASLKKNSKIEAEDIPAATQLFTPHWIVRYLVENSLGRLWMLNHPDLEAGRADGLLHHSRSRRRPTSCAISSPEEIKALRPGLRLGAHADLRLRPAVRHLRRAGLRPGRTSRG